MFVSAAVRSSKMSSRSDLFWSRPLPRQAGCLRFVQRCPEEKRLRRCYRRGPDQACRGNGGSDARSCQGRAWRLSKIEQHLSLSDVDHRHDPVIAVDDDDLVTDDEVHVSTPFGLDVQDQLRNGDDSHAGRNGHADVD
jgi:hypothetical protein